MTRPVPLLYNSPVEDQEGRDAPTWKEIREDAPAFGEVRIVFRDGAPQVWHVTTTRKPATPREVSKD